MSGRAGQSPPPEEQSGRQGTDVPGSSTGGQDSGKGVSDSGDNKAQSKKDLEALSSNPTHPLENAAHDKTSKPDGKNTKQ